MRRTKITLGQLERLLFSAADLLYNNMDAAGYKHVVLGRIYDPACRSGGMFVRSGKFVEAHGRNCDGMHRAQAE